MRLIDTLLNPSRSLVVTFAADGTIVVNRRVRQGDGTYARTKLDFFQVKTGSGQDTVSFEFGLDPDPDNNDSTSALFVELTADWPDVKWDDDVAGILGGNEQFPFGNGPVGLNEANVPKRPRTRVKKGVFTNIDQGDGHSVQPGSQVTLFGERKISTYQVGVVPTKAFALWLPNEEVTGYVKFSPWRGTDATFRSVDDVK